VPIRRRIKTIIEELASTTVIWKYRSKDFVTSAVCSIPDLPCCLLGPGGSGSALADHHLLAKLKR
jgi:hypothetical protein